MVLLGAAGAVGVNVFGELGLQGLAEELGLVGDTGVGAAVEVILGVMEHGRLAQALVVVLGLGQVEHSGVVGVREHGVHGLAGADQVIL